MFYRLLSCPFLGKRVFRKMILKREKGEVRSDSIREYYKKKHSMIVGKYSYGCFDDSFNYSNAGEIEIGRYCSFAPDIHYFGANHPVNSFSTSPIFYRDMFGYKVKDVKRYKLIIGNDVWIGYGVYITCGCHEIGNGSVIAAGSVITSNVPAYSIIGGVPAKIIKYRFDDETISMLEKSKWYELDPDEIMKYYQYANNPYEFAQKILQKSGSSSPCVSQ